MTSETESIVNHERLPGLIVRQIDSAALFINRYFAKKVHDHVLPVRLRYTEFCVISAAVFESVIIAIPLEVPPGRQNRMAHMKMFLDCLPCVLNQILDASRMSTQDEKIHAEIMAEGFMILAQYENYHSSPDIVADLHKIVKRKTGVDDPYCAIKKRDIEAALKVYPLLIHYLDSGLIEGRKGPDAFLTNAVQSKMYRALKIAVTGNIMDSAIIKEVDLDRSLSAELEKAFVRCDLELFMRKISSAKTVLIIGDNAGEAVFDRVLVDYLNHPNLYYAVRDIPIINDVTMEDALAAGLGDGIHLISSGSDAPAAIVSRCSTEFLELFHCADVIISKGQGNFEALSDCGREVFFLLKAKCAMIARRLDITMNEYVFFRGGDDSPGA